MRVVLCQRKNGLPDSLAFFMKSMESLTSTSSKAVMSYLAPTSPSPVPPYGVRPGSGPAASGARLTGRGHSGSGRQLTGDEIRASGGAACFGIVVTESHAFRRQTIEVGRLPRHDALMIGADIEPADIVTHDEEDVRPLLR